MTPQQKAGILRPLLAVLLGTLLTGVTFRLAANASAACECSRPIIIAFPFATIIWSLRVWESLGGFLMAFQFPAYAVVVALGKTRKERARFALILLAVHAVGAVVGFLTYRGSGT